MKFIFFGELYPNTTIEASSYTEAYDKVVKEFYKDCMCSGSVAHVKEIEFIEVTAWAEIWDEEEGSSFTYERRPMFIAEEGTYKKLPQSFLDLFK